MQVWCVIWIKSLLILLVLTKERMYEMKIAIDAMGGDNAPESVVKGALKARDEFSDLELIL